MHRDVFQALADPTWRAILNLLAEQSLPINKVVENFAISRPAISRHIKILTAWMTFCKTFKQEKPD